MWAVNEVKLSLEVGDQTALKAQCMIDVRVVLFARVFWPLNWQCIILIGIIGIANKDQSSVELSYNVILDIKPGFVVS